MYFLLRNEQHERFVAAQSVITAGGNDNTLTVPVANGTLLNGVTAVASVVNAPTPGTTVKSSVANGKITLTPVGANPNDRITVAWLVDTMPPATATVAPAVG